MSSSILDLKNRIDADTSLFAILQEVRKRADGDAAHNEAHLLRVALWTKNFSLGLIPEKNAIAAALLHDFINVPKNSPDRDRASSLSAEAAEPILLREKFQREDIRSIQLAIRDHSFSRGAKPENFLGECLQDADRLEALGAIGIMRVFSTGVKLGAEYFHSADPWAKNRERDDLHYSVDHFFKKLLTLESTMNTAGGRLEAKKRTETLRQFLVSLGEEIGEPCVF